MVHTWISLRNDKINSPCQNKRILRIFRNESVRFYGDYNLDIYLGTKHDYTNLEQVISKVINISGGWIKNITLNDNYQDIDDYHLLIDFKYITTL